MQAQFHAPSVQARASAGITKVLWHGLTETPLALDALDSALKLDTEEVTLP